MLEGFHMSDDQLKIRTEELLRSAERISKELVMQSERLADAIDSFEREIITPLRERLNDHE